MTPKVLKQFPTIAVAAALFAAAAPAFGQKITARSSGTEAVPGEMLTVQVNVSDPKQATAPTPPKTDDFEIRLLNVTPSENTSVQIINGRMTRRSSYGYQFAVKPLRSGRLVLPPFTYVEDGRTYSTQPIIISVAKEEGGPLVKVYVKTEKAAAYIGERIGLTLEVWIEKFSQPGIGPLGPDSMWSNATIDTAATNWGVFADADLGRPTVEEVESRAPDGGTRRCYVFTVERSTAPTRAGPFDFGPIEFVYNYPLRLSRDFFGGYRIQRSRRLSVVPDLPKLLIQPIPTEGRPPDYNGAVGVYSITAVAKPTEVPVGDPITLTMRIRGAGQLDRLSPPRLDRVPEITRDFEVSGDSPAGEVAADGKVFSLTLRALREDVTEIPPIPFSFFDPTKGRFATARSRPIPLKVRPAERLALTDSSPGGGSVAVLTPLVESTEGLLANDTDVDAILADQSPEAGPLIWAVLAAMPLIYGVLWVVQSRSARLRDNVALRRRSRALSQARRALDQGRSTDPATIRAALLGYIADCRNVPAAGLTRPEAVRLVSERVDSDATVAALDDLLGSLEVAEYAGDDSAALDGAAGRALELIGALDRSGMR